MEDAGLSRLRRLDALFAERVLGYTTKQFRVLHGAISQDGWALIDRPGKGDILLPYPRPLPEYTRSVDEAWAGVPMVCKPRRLGFMLETQGAIGPGWMRATFHSPDGEAFVKWAVAGHPAEALVLACLRAVGTPEAEIEEALAEDGK